MKNYPILQSIVESLGATLLHSLWQGFLIAFILMIILKINSNKSPQFKYHLSCASLFGMVLWMGSTFFSYFNFNYAEEKTGIILNNTPIHAIISPNHPTAINWQVNLEVYFSSFIDLYADKLVFIWMLGVILFGIKWAGALYYTQSLKRKHINPLPLKWQNKIKQLSYDMGINKHINILESAKVDVPLVIGYLKPVILIPSSALTGFTPAQLESVIVHELAHIKNNDFLMNMILSSLEVILFYHPAYWYINRIIMQERENRCDDMAVAHLGNPRLYAETLFNMEKIRQQHSLGMSFQGNKNQLLERIKRICVAPNYHYKGGMNPSGITLGLLCILAIISLSHVPMDAKESIIDPLKEEVREILDLSANNEITEHDDIEGIIEEETFLYFPEEEAPMSGLETEEYILEERANHPISKINISPSNPLLEKEKNSVLNLMGITLKKQEKKDTIPTPENTETTIRCNTDKEGTTTLNYFNNEGENYRRIVIKKGKAKMKLNGVKTPFENKDYFLKKGDNLSLKGTMRIYDLEEDEDNSFFLEADKIEYNENQENIFGKEEGFSDEDIIVLTDEHIEEYKAKGNIRIKGKGNEEDIIIILDEDIDNENIFLLEKDDEIRHEKEIEIHHKHMEKHHKEMEKHHKEIERMQIEIEKEHQEKIKEHEKRMDAHHEEMEELEKNHYRIRAESKAIGKEMKQLQNDLVDMLKADGLIKRKNKFKFSLTSKELKVNGKVQPPNIHKKYLEWYEEFSGKIMDNNSKHMIKIN